MRQLMIGVALLMLAACGEEQAQSGASGGASEVLEGTASDAMLPLATVTSQPPLAAPEPEEAPRRAAPQAVPTATASPEAEPDAPAAE